MQPIIHKWLTYNITLLLFLTSCRSLDKEVQDVIGSVEPQQQQELVLR